MHKELIVTIISLNTYRMMIRALADRTKERTLTMKELKQLYPTHYIPFND